jgi:hypothetical protein
MRLASPPVAVARDICAVLLGDVVTNAFKFSF